MTCYSNAPADKHRRHLPAHSACVRSDVDASLCVVWTNRDKFAEITSPPHEPKRPYQALVISDYSKYITLEQQNKSHVIYYDTLSEAIQKIILIF